MHRSIHSQAWAQARVHELWAGGAVGRAGAEAALESESARKEITDVVHVVVTVSQSGDL